MQTNKGEIFKFGTKAETLERIRPLLKNPLIPNQIYFSIKEWDENKEQITEKIKNFFHSEFLIVRSSAVNEDTKKFSMAGNYQSILNVKKDEEDLKKAVEKVRNSYLKDHEENPEDQILIQSMVINANMSGVIFTRCNNTGAPYLIINYEVSSNTNGVTSGSSSNLRTFTFFKYLDKLPSDIFLANLIKIAREIEEITKSDSLDIEFVIEKNQIYILQIRPITSLKKTEKNLDEKIGKTIENIKVFIRNNDRKFPNIYGYKALFGSMPDWNPAEIIGDSPKPLSFSLYRELITDYIWPLSRKEVGYKDVGYHPGVVSLGGKPYIDVRLSFNTFVPAKISETTSEKLVNFYIDKLINNPEMHDKIEFKIAYTCYNFGFEKNERELNQNSFSSLQIKEIKEALLELTNDIIEEKNTSIEYELSLNELLRIKRNKIIESDINHDVKISQLIHDCKYYGTLPFSKLARFAFIGNILLSSLVELDVIKKEDKENFIKSINSVASDFLEKLFLLKNNQIKKEDFLEEFGHLRPGTYDICSGTYKECFEDYFNLDKIQTGYQSRNFELDYLKKKKIEELITLEGFRFTVDKFLDFTKRALTAREKSKLEFTKNLSLILDYCYDSMKKYGFTKEDTAFLEIDDILSFSHKSKSFNEIKDFKEKLEKNKEEYEITKALRLPPLIYIEKNVEYFHQFDNKPNFITSKSIVGEIALLGENLKISDLDDKIVLITNADPGYDWIFSHNIKGLITRYGGVGSHMSIRCAELDIPAAIGCGASIFEYVKNFKKIELNCATNQIKGIL